MGKKGRKGKLRAPERMGNHKMAYSSTRGKNLGGQVPSNVSALCLVCDEDVQLEPLHQLQWQSRIVWYGTRAYLLLLVPNPNLGLTQARKLKRIRIQWNHSENGSRSLSWSTTSYRARSCLLRQPFWPQQKRSY